MGRERYSTLIDKVTNEYMHVVANKHLAESEGPMLLKPETTMKDLITQYPDVNFGNCFIIDIYIERRTHQKRTQLGEKSRILSEFPQRLTVCPVCKTREDGQTAMIYVAGSNKDGVGIAEPVHLDCIVRNLVYYKETDLIALAITPEEE